MKTTHTHQKAFTLIEVLVVVVLISIAVSYLTVSIRGGSISKKYEEFAKQLTAISVYALDYAIFNSTEVGLVFDQVDNKYWFVMLDDKKIWQELRGEEPLRKRDIPGYVTLDITLEGDEVTLEDEQSQNNLKRNRPQVLFLSSGEVIPFEIRLNTKSIPTTYRIKGSFTGQIKLLKNDAEL